MDERTQKLLALLASESAPRLLTALRADPATEEQLRAVLGISQPVVNRYLNALASYGLVERGFPVKTGRPGRPVRTWQLSSTSNLDRLERCLECCAARLP